MKSAVADGGGGTSDVQDDYFGAQVHLGDDLVKTGEDDELSELQGFVSKIRSIFEGSADATTATTTSAVTPTVVSPGVGRRSRKTSASIAQLIQQVSSSPFIKPAPKPPPIVTDSPLVQATSSHASPSSLLTIQLRTPPMSRPISSMTTHEDAQNLQALATSD